MMRNLAHSSRSQALLGNAAMMLAGVRDFLILLKLAALKIGYIIHDKSAAAIS